MRSPSGEITQSCFQKLGNCSPLYEEIRKCPAKLYLDHLMSDILKRASASRGETKIGGGGLCEVCLCATSLTWSTSNLVTSLEWSSRGFPRAAEER